MTLQTTKSTLGRLAVWTALLLVPGLSLAAPAGSPPEGPSLSPAPPPTAAAGDTGPWRHEVQGLTVELEIEPISAAGGEGRLLAEGEARFMFRLEDQLGAPLTGAYPAAWMDWKPPGVEGETCRAKVEAFLGGSLLSPPELDLNVYYVLALNDDATISVVDPLFGFGTTKLLDMVFLDSPGYDWVLSPDAERLYVSMPEAGLLARVDTAAWEVLDTLDVGPEPRRLALSPDGRVLWAAWGATDGDPGDRATTGGVSAVDTAVWDAADGRNPVRRFATGASPRDLALSEDGRYLVAVGEEAVVLDGDRLALLHRLELPPEPVSVAWSTVARAAWISHRPGGLTGVDPATGTIVGRVETPPGLGAIAFAPDGRLGFIVSPPRDELHILDAATGRLVQTADTEDGPERVAFSDELAYLRHRGTDTVLMIPLGEVGGEGRPVPMVDFPGGQRPPGRSAHPTPAAGIVQAPGATAVLVANPEDRAIYFYKEGMAAPMGHFRNYSRQPRAVLAVDRSLRERRPGHYETTASLRRAGRYDVAFFVDSPRILHCFEVTVAPDPAAETPRRAKLAVRPASPAAGELLTAGEATELRFQVVDPATETPVPDLDLRVLTFRGSGLGQRRTWAEGTGEPGTYRVAFRPERQGVYYVFVDCPERGVAFNDGTGWVLQVEAPRSTTAGAGRVPGD